jgi:LPS-assembly protein
VLLPEQLLRGEIARNAIIMANRLAGFRRLITLLRLLAIFAIAAQFARGQTETPTPSPQTPASGPGVAQLEANQQRKVGQVYYADGNVEIRYRGTRLQADRAEYNAATDDVLLNGHVQFDYLTEHLKADHAQYNLRSGKGHFDNVSGSLKIERKANPQLLVTPNPLSFDAASVDRLTEDTYRIYTAKITVCDPAHPTWTFEARRATLHVNQNVALLYTNFRLFRIPIIYLPYADVPNEKSRQSGFMMPELSKSSIKGTIIGDAYYWAPSSWADATGGLQYLSLRGWEQNGNVRLKPSDNTTITGNYFGVIDRLGEGGHTLNIQVNTQLNGGWHVAADINQLTSLLFQEVFSPTFNEAVNSEVNTTAFATKHFDGFNFSFDVHDYKNFLTAAPQTSIDLHALPEVRFGSMDRAPWKRWPIYFGFDAFDDAIHRSDPGETEPNGAVIPAIDTREFVDRSEFAPRVTIPLHWHDWLGVTPTYTIRTTLYGAQDINGIVANIPLWRNTGELGVDFRPPAFERVWQSGHTKWKHTIEPDIVYNYVFGVSDFSRIIRVDQDDTISDTNQFQYSITQRLFRKTGSGAAEEFASWTLLEDYYFDPTFGGALIVGERNVLAPLDSVTPFAFADGLRRLSPIVSDIRITPGGPYDAEFRIDYDPQRMRVTTAETLVKMHPHGKFEVSIADYDTDASSVLQPLSSQIRTLLNYGDQTKKGWNLSAGFSYDLREKVAQNELAQIGYNGSCCGLAIGFQRLSLGTIRVENQFRASLIIANIGSFGNLMRRQETVY